MRVLFFSTHHRGHYKAMLALVQRFVSGGHQVEFVAPSEPELVADVRRAGASHTPYKGDAAWTLHDAALRVTRDELGEEPDALLERDLLFVQVLPATLDLLDFCVQALRDREPGLVVYDSACAWAKLAARIAGVPAVSSCSSTIMSRDERLAVCGFLRDRPEVRKAVAALRERHGVEYDPADAYTNYEEDGRGLTLVWSVPELQPHSADHARYFGSAVLPTAGAPSAPAPAPVPVPATDGFSMGDVDALTGAGDTRRRLVYLSMGTVVGQERWNVSTVPVLRAAVEAFRGRDGEALVMSIGAAVDPADLGELPPNVRAYTRVPQVRVLERADLFVTHGGNNGFNEALFTRTPLVVLPVFGDQNMNAATTLRLGLGETVPSPFAPAPAENLDHITAGVLRAKIDAVFADYGRYLDGVAKVQARLLERWRYLQDEAVGELVAFAERRKAGRA